MILKLKRTPGIYLVGFMAAGKTTIGRQLSARLGWHFADLDEDIEAREKSAIHEIFDSRGETEFRRIENALLGERIRAVETGYPTVLALGGGAFTQDANFQLLSDRGISIWLDCPVDIAWQRVSQTSHRPLARDRQKFLELHAARKPFYSRADHRVEITSDDPSVAADAILTLLKLA